VNLLEQAIGLPVDSVTSGFRVRRRPARQVPTRGSTEYGKAAQWRL